MLMLPGLMVPFNISELSVAPPKAGLAKLGEPAL